jgi:spermidine/putrescine-binding protein
LAKGNVVQFWAGENEANAGFVANGATVGLCWDSTGYNLRNDGYGYAAPTEGAFAWHQGLMLMKNAVNVDQAHELAKWVSSPEGAAMWASAFSSNAVGKGAAALMNPDVATYYNSAFDDAKLAPPDKGCLTSTPGPNGSGVLHCTGYNPISVLHRRHGLLGCKKNIKYDHGEGCCHECRD